jgi:peptidoglycan-associated lipoprotein
MMLAGCKKKVAPTPPPPPPPAPPAPTASISASPATVEKGQSTTLTWQTSNATDVTIEGIGAVQPNGSQKVSPADSTTYRLVAKGEGGTQDATTRVTVTLPPPPPAPAPTVSEEQQFNEAIKDIYFDYDRYDVRAEDKPTLDGDAQWLKDHATVNFTIEGNCDERGSSEYNLALGDSRANSVKKALVAAGISADRVKTVSFGKEKPVCSEQNEACWKQNRRAHLAYGK